MKAQALQFTPRRTLVRINEDEWVVTDSYLEAMWALFLDASPQVSYVEHHPRALHAKWHSDFAIDLADGRSLLAEVKPSVAHWLASPQSAAAEELGMPYLLLCEGGFVYEAPDWTQPRRVQPGGAWSDLYGLIYKSKRGEMLKKHPSAFQRARLAPSKLAAMPPLDWRLPV